jgi:predicted P-loop ATPase/GTPase
MVLMEYLKGEDAEKQREMVEKIRKITKKHLMVIKTKEENVHIVSDSDPIKEDIEENIDMLEKAIDICKRNLKELEDMKIN